MVDHDSAILDDHAAGPLGRSAVRRCVYQLNVDGARPLREDVVTCGGTRSGGGPLHQVDLSGCPRACDSLAAEDLGRVLI